ncbi:MULTISPECIES: O-antigen ligase family protein [unclassified Microbacterium]|uniref:O-antigen ligase family protein n=1 Tax=unclassified Microbacterium TaxID=2609290 RepID=UPI0010F8F3A0|nr:MULTISPECIES: O-antigen ligase family protein [unclassified Microbacterium]
MRDRLKLIARVVLVGSVTYLVLLPVGHTAVLTGVLGLLGISSAALVFLESRRLSRELWVPASLSLAIIVFGAVVGLGNEGWSHSLIAWVAAPVLFWVWAVALDARTVRLVLVAVAAATVALSAVTIGVAGSGLLPIGYQFANVSVHGQWFGAVVGMYGMSSFIALAPMWVTALFFRGRPFLPPWWLVLLAAVGSLLSTVVSSRRAVLAGVVIAPIVVLICYLATRDRSVPLFLSRKAMLTAVIGACVAAVAVVLGILSPVGQKAAQGGVALITGSGAGADERLRLEQMDELWDGFLASPIWGHGIGATIEGYSRSNDRPWSFEMQYHLILFQTGIIGVLLLAAVVVFVVRALWMAQRRSPEMRPVLAVASSGALAMLIANSLNPLLQAPGHFWAVFLLIGAINIALRDEKELV